MTSPTFLFTADLHLTSKSEDEYRWEIFPWLRKRITHYGVDSVFILGDLTHAKDEHDASLVNRLMRELTRLSAAARTIILKGNHDYALDPELPFFRFLGTEGRLAFVSSVSTETISGQRFLFLPHTRTYEKDWQQGTNFGNFDFVCAHQAFRGAKMENGAIVTVGVPSQAVGPDRIGNALVIAGDIHVPQQVRNIHYCGAPHPIRYGDEWQPRVLLYQEGKLISLPRQTIKKAILRAKSVEELDATTLTEGDRARVTVSMPRSEFQNWPEITRRIRGWANEKGIHLASLELHEQVARLRLKTQKPPATGSQTSITTWLEYATKFRLSPALRQWGTTFLDRYIV